MEKITQKTISEKAGITAAMLSQLLNGKRRAGWKTAKGLEKATGLPAILFLEGALVDIQTAIQAHLEDDREKASS